MNFWAIVAIIAIIGAFASIHRSKRRERRDCMRDDIGQFEAASTERENELEREVEGLRERIRVLERIATDDHRAKRISDEIESLRDK